MQWSAEGYARGSRSLSSAPFSLSVTISGGGLDVDVGGTTEVTGGIIGSESNQLDLTITNLVLNDLIERERSRQVSLNASFKNSGPPSSGNTPPPINSTDSGGSEFNVGGVGGSFSRSALDGTTRATIGQGNVTVTGQSEDETAAQLADTNRDINNATTITRDTNFDTGNVFIDVGAARRVSDNLEIINESFDLIIERPLTGLPLDTTKEDQTILKRISDFFKNSTSVNDSNNTETSSQSVNNGVFTYTRDVFNEDGSVIQVSIDLKAFNVTQEQADDFLADLPNEFLVRYNGTSFVDNYRPTQWYSFANEEASWSGHDTSRDLISIGYQISDILTPEEGFGHPQSVLFGIVGGTRFGQQPEDDILITQNAVESGVTQVIATLIHERAHLWDTNLQGGYYDLSLRRHQEIYNDVYEILTDAGFDPNGFNMRRDLFP